MELERCCGERARIILPAAKLVCSKMGLRKETLLVLELSAIRFWISQAVIGTLQPRCLSSSWLPPKSYKRD